MVVVGSPASLWDFETGLSLVRRKARLAVPAPVACVTWRSKMAGDTLSRNGCGEVEYQESRGLDPTSRARMRGLKAFTPRSRTLLEKKSDAWQKVTTYHERARAGHGTPLLIEPTPCSIPEVPRRLARSQGLVP